MRFGVRARAPGVPSDYHISVRPRAQPLRSGSGQTAWPRRPQQCPAQAHGRGAEPVALGLRRDPRLTRRWHRGRGPTPGRPTFADFTLERGGTQDRDLFDWFQDVAITSSGLGLTDVNYKRNLDIVQQDRDGTTLRRWTLSRAWPTKFVAGRVGQRERRERHRVGHAHVRLLRAGTVSLQPS